MMHLLIAAAMLAQALGEPGPKKPAIETLNKTRVLRLVNEIRAKGCQCGDTWYGPAGPLSWNDQLEAAAQKHSDDMMDRNYFAHRSPENKNAGFRIEQAGYSWLSYGENIGKGYRDEAEVVQAWKTSPSHCKNLMNATFRDMAVARNGQYWTQTFGKK